MAPNCSNLDHECITEALELTHLYATRQNGVLTFDRPVQVYDMREYTLERLLHEPLPSNKASSLVIETIQITAKHSLKKIPSNSNKSFMEVTFHSMGIRQAPNRRVVCKSKSVQIATPMGWTPETFLAAVNHSVKVFGYVLLQRIELLDATNGELKMYSFGINELHHYYKHNLEDLKLQLRGTASFVDVAGGHGSYHPPHISL